MAEIIVTIEIILSFYKKLNWPNEIVHVLNKITPFPHPRTAA